jgi:hypothetical protein
MPLKNDEKSNVGVSLPEPTPVRPLNRSHRQWFGHRHRVLNCDVKGRRRKVVPIDTQWRTNSSPEKPCSPFLQRYCNFMTFP